MPVASMYTLRYHVSSSHSKGFGNMCFRLFQISNFHISYYTYIVMKRDYDQLLVNNIMLNLSKTHRPMLCNYIKPDLPQ